MTRLLASAIASGKEQEQLLHESTPPEGTTEGNGNHTCDSRHSSLQQTDSVCHECTDIQGKKDCEVRINHDNRVLFMHVFVVFAIYITISVPRQNLSLLLYYQ
jgi:hypothetical protein